ncbi:MAG: hypothetical protein M1834_009275 [Cirrosporium novae-zelandiae]|nr:MAG: hypothetical protein M1834_009275 [Cirrosporium novae-zelandiae]
MDSYTLYYNNKNEYIMEYLRRLDWNPSKRTQDDMAVETLEMRDGCVVQGPPKKRGASTEQAIDQIVDAMMASIEYSPGYFKPVACSPLSLEEPTPPKPEWIISEKLSFAPTAPPAAPPAASPTQSSSEVIADLIFSHYYGRIIQCPQLRETKAWKVRKFFSSSPSSSSPTAGLFPHLPPDGEEPVVPVFDKEAQREADARLAAELAEDVVVGGASEPSGPKRKKKNKGGKKGKKGKM